MRRKKCLAEILQKATDDHFGFIFTTQGVGPGQAAWCGCRWGFVAKVGSQVPSGSTVCAHASMLEKLHLHRVYCREAWYTVHPQPCRRKSF